MDKLPPTPGRRQPPPPRCRRDAEQGDALVVGDNGICSRPYYFRRCKRIRPTNIESLSDDLLFQILVHLPAQHIYDWVRFVCWKWYRIIHTHSFIYAHLQSSTSGLFVQSISCHKFVSMRERQFEISNFKNHHLKLPICSGWNGLMVRRFSEDLNSISILNPVTNQNFKVPRFHKGIDTSVVCIAFSAISMEYKVVVAYWPCPPSECDNELYILTLGVDKSWRPINIQHLSLQTKKNMLRAAPLVTEGFIHWARSSYDVVTMNVETEIFTETPFPVPQNVGGEQKRATIYMSSGNDRLSLFIARGGFSWDVWEMKPETGEWRKLYDIDIEDQKCELEKQFCFGNVESVRPNQWLNYPEAFFIHIYGSRGHCSGWREEKLFHFAMYNLRRREIQALKLPKYYRRNLIPHRNSLVWMAGS